MCAETLRLQAIQTRCHHNPEQDNGHCGKLPPEHDFGEPDAAFAGQFDQEGKRRQAKYREQAQPERKQPSILTMCNPPGHSGHA